VLLSEKVAVYLIDGIDGTKKTGSLPPSGGCPSRISLTWSCRFVMFRQPPHRGLLIEDKGHPGGRLLVAGPPVSPGRGPSFPKLAAGRRTDGPLVRVSAGERSELQRWARSRTQRHRTVVRSRIVLLASRGLTVPEVAAHVHVAPATVRLWIRRFQQGGVGALERDARGRGRRPGMLRDVVLSVLQTMRQADDAERSSRRIAAAAGTSAATVWRVWTRFGLNATSSVKEIDDVIEKVISEATNATC
jgi:transposase